VESLSDYSRCCGSDEPLPVRQERCCVVWDHESTHSSDVEVERRLGKSWICRLEYFVVVRLWLHQAQPVQVLLDVLDV
jgi:hypothetical protein